MTHLAQWSTAYMATFEAVRSQLWSCNTECFKVAYHKGTKAQKEAYHQAASDMDLVLTMAIGEDWEEFRVAVYDVIHACASEPPGKESKDKPKGKRRADSMEPQPVKRQALAPLDVNGPPLAAPITPVLHLPPATTRANIARRVVMILLADTSRPQYAAWLRKIPVELWVKLLAKSPSAAARKVIDDGVYDRDS